MPKKQKIKKFKQQYQHQIKLLKKHCDCIANFIARNQEELIMVMLDAKDARWLDWEKEMIKNLLTELDK